MKRFLFAFVLLLFIFPVYAQSKIDVLHYKFDIALSDNNDSITGIAVIRFTTNEETKELSFDLAMVGKSGKGMIVSKVIFNNPTSHTSSFKQVKNKLIITSHTHFHKRDTASVTIYYKGIPADGLIISKNKYGNRTFFSDNWPNRAHNWIPCVDDPADKATVEFIVTAPAHYQVISNGIQVEVTNLPGNKKLTHWKEDVPLPTKVMVIGVAGFAVNLAGIINECIPVYSWVYPENKKEGFYDYAPAKEILEYYINYIGPYPYKKLANVQSKTMFGGMENASAIFYYENSVTGKQQEESLIAHEIVHQWFGDMATEKSFAHVWLSEGFATYLTHVFIESKYGTDSLDKRMQEDRVKVIGFVKKIQKPVIDNNPDYMQLLNTNSYQKGGWILHMLRRELGDSIFKKSINAYYKTFAGKNADSKDFQQIVETVSGKNLEQFFKQWLYTSENPDLEINWKYNENDKQLNVTVKQLQKTVFSFPLQISIGVSGGNSKPQIKELAITKQTETFLIPVGSKVSLLSSGIDPFTSLLAEISCAEMK